MSRKTTPESVLKAPNAREAAKRLGAYLKGLYGKDADIKVWSPDETKYYGWGSGWSVCWEGGPFNWTVGLSLGGHINAEDIGFDKVGPFPNGLHAKSWGAEPYNHFVMNFYVDK